MSGLLSAAAFTAIVLGSSPIDNVGSCVASIPIYRSNSNPIEGSLEAELSIVFSGTQDSIFEAKVSLIQMFPNTNFTALPIYDDLFYLVVSEKRFEMLEPTNSIAQLMGIYGSELDTKKVCEIAVSYKLGFQGYSLINGDEVIRGQYFPISVKTQ